MTSVVLNGFTVATYASLSVFPSSASDGSLAVALDTDSLYEFDGDTSTWVLIGPGGGGGGGISDLTGDVTATGPGSAVATVVSVGGSSASDVHSAELLANAATSSNTVSTIVKRNISGDFTAGTITADLVGDVTGNATNVTGIVAIANGGTNNSTAYTSGSIVFSNGTSLTEDNTSLYWDDTLKVMHLKSNTIEIGSVDAFSRTQIWNHGSNASLRLGALGQDGDPTDVSSEGSVFYGPNSQGTPINSATGDFGYARVKADRFGLYTSISNTAFYYFRADPTSLFLANDSNTKTFEVTRSTGNIKSNSLTASTALVSDASKNIISSAVTSTELGYVSGVTSAIQTQLNAKAAHVIPSTNQIVYVSSLSGSNVTGDGSYDKPWATVAFAMTQITDSSSTKPYTISILAGRQVETTDVLWKPYVFIVGGMQRASYIRINGGSFKPDASMSANSWIGLQNIYVGGGTPINMDMQAIGGNNLVLVVEDCTLGGALTIKGRNAGGGDYLEMYNTLVFGAVTLDSCNSQLQAIEFVGALTFTDTQAAGSSYTVDFSTVNSGISSGTSGSLNQIAYAGGCTFTTTAAVTIDSFRGLPPKSLRTLFAGTTITNRDDSSMLPYTPTTPGDWSSVPTDVKEALDTLAAAAPSASYVVNEFTLSSTDITNKSVTLTSAPSNPTLTVLQVIGGGVQEYTTDFTVSGSTLSWSGLFLDGVLVAGDKLIVQLY